MAIGGTAHYTLSQHANGTIGSLLAWRNGAPAAARPQPGCPRRAVDPVPPLDQGGFDSCEVKPGFRVALRSYVRTVFRPILPQMQPISRRPVRQKN
jgi:hypothetical protein